MSARVEIRFNIDVDEELYNELISCDPALACELLPEAAEEAIDQNAEVQVVSIA